MRLEDFLFAEQIDESVSRYVLETYPNLSFLTSEEFYNFFDSQNVVLVKDAEFSLTERQTLLQRFKDFKSSTDYASMKKYIQYQKKIREALKVGDIPSATTLLESVNTLAADPFFTFIARKLITGSDSGELPSERTMIILDELMRQNQADIDREADVVRDVDGTIQSFKNYLRNKGSLKVNLVDERYLTESFRYVVDTEFKQIDEAVDAEINILKKAADLTNIGGDVGNLTEDLKKLIIENSSSVPALQAKVESLQEIVDSLQEVVELKDSSVDDLLNVIEELSNRHNDALNEIDVKDQTILELNNTITETLEELQRNVLSQLENSGDSFDELADRLEQQSKEQQEAAEKNLQAFKDAIKSITESLAPEPEKPEAKEDDPPEEKRRKEKVAKAQDMWDKVKYIHSRPLFGSPTLAGGGGGDTSVSALEKLVTLLGGKLTEKNKYVDYNGTLASRVSQVYTWNTVYKPQFKALITLGNIKTEADANIVISIVDSLTTTPDAEKPVRNFLYNSQKDDVFDKWRDDVNRTRGVNAPKVRDICGLLGVQYSESSTVAIEKALSNASFDTVIEVLGIVNEFQDKNY